MTNRGSRFVLLSYPLRAGSPVWPANPPAADVSLHASIARGDHSNTSALRLFSHSGTHVDTPWHFNPDGPAGWQLPIDSFVFEAPAVIDTPARADGGFITAQDLGPHGEAIESADLVLVRTGWSRYRASDPARYVGSGPLLHPAAARWLMDGHPRLRGVAIDAVSIGSPAFPDESTETHHVLTGVGRTDGRFALIYEDVWIPDAAAPLARVFAWPLMVEGADGTPVTMVGELRGEARGSGR